MHAKEGTRISIGSKETHGMIQDNMVQKVLEDTTKKENGWQQMEMVKITERGTADFTSINPYETQTITEAADI
jgi:hypothetical protein